MVPIPTLTSYRTYLLGILGVWCRGPQVEVLLTRTSCGLGCQLPVPMPVPTPYLEDKKQ
jgi:hypothetical protein